MTIAICACCGKSKAGAFINCRFCDYATVTGWDRAIAVIYSDQMIQLDSLKEMSIEIQRRYSYNDPSIMQLDENGKKFIDGHLARPDYRDLLELERRAKDSFFRKQINFHCIGPDGYSSEVVTRGAELDKKSFDNLRKENGSDVFFLELYEKGESIRNNIPKFIWYCMKDIFYYIDETSSSHSPRASRLLALGRNYTENFVSNIFNKS